jgi:membrane protease YdiL (CAAX protease family)
VPESYAATVVGLCFLVATYLFTLHGDRQARAADWGLSLGGLLEPEPLDARRLLGALGRALGAATLVSLVVFPPFWVGFRVWYGTKSAFHLPFDWAVLDAVLGQVLVIALPEEAFFRGYLQTALGRRWPPTLRLGGALVGNDVLVTSAVFALGHFATDPNPTRLAVFFPSLVFGWLRARTGGIGASVAFHAACNLFASLLARGYGLTS